MAIAVVCVFAIAGQAGAVGWTEPADLPFSATDIGFDGEGNAVLVGIGAGPEGDPAVLAASREAGGEWSEPELLHDAGGSNVTMPRVAVDPLGNAVAVWAEIAGNGKVQAASRGSDGVWQDPVQISTATVAFTFRAYDVVIDHQGTATVVWNEFDGASTYIYRTRSRPLGGS